MNFAGGLFFLLNTISDLYLYLIVARFVSQTVRADFYNPVSQFIFKATSPLLTPMRRIIPGVGGIDVACIVLLYLLIVIKLLVFGVLFGINGLVGVESLIYAIIGVKGGIFISGMLGLTINFFLFVIFLSVIMSWVAMGGQGYNPIMIIIRQLSEPIIAPIRRVVPPAGMFDFSAMIAIFGLMTIKIIFGV